MSKSLVAKALAVGAAATLALGMSACGSSDDNASSDSNDKLVFAAVPSEDSQSLEAQYEVINKLIKAETGKDVEMQQATDYSAVIEGMRAGKVDMAMMGPFSYIIATDSGVKLQPLGAVADAADAAPGYYSIGWAKADSDVKSIDDFADKNVCFVDVASTSGYLYPSAGLLAADIDPETGVKPVMAGGHDASMLAINSGQCDAGFAFEAMGETLVKGGQLDEGALVEVWRSEQIAGSPLAINTDTVDADTVAKLTEVISTKANKPYLVEAGICSSEDDCALPEDSDYGFKEYEDKEYDGVRKVCELTEAKACQG